jgi:Lysozyme like domain/Putative peptidoglycan binding domain
MSKGKHRKQPRRRGRAAVAAVGVIGATAGMMMSASPADASTVVPDTTIAAVARNAGLGGCGGVPLGAWVAVALAESGGNPYAHATYGEDSRGLWQINMRAHAGWVGNRNLYDPATNAWAARQVCQGSGPRAWTTYATGAYLRYLWRGNAAAAGAGSGIGAFPIAAPASYQTKPVSGSGPTLSMRTGGSQPQAVRDIQQKLAALGYPVKVDGVFGPQTNQQVKLYQSRHGLVADGVVGPRTRAALFGSA